MKVRVTEYLNIDLDNEMWCCERCDSELISAYENYKKGCLVSEKPLNEVHPPLTFDRSYSFSPDPNFCRILEFYCPYCGVMIENEYLPPGHPITHDIELDIESIKRRKEETYGNR